MSMFTKRHYVWLASVARDMRQSYADAAKNPDLSDLAIETLVDSLESESPGFDKKLFLKNVYEPTKDSNEFFAEAEALKSVI